MIVHRSVYYWIVCAVGSVHVVTYKDKTVQKLRLTELSDSKYSISWDLVESIPAHHTSGASYTVRLRSVTAGTTAASHLSAVPVVHALPLCLQVI